MEKVWTHTVPAFVSTTYFFSSCLRCRWLTVRFPFQFQWKYSSGSECVCYTHIWNKCINTKPLIRITRGPFNFLNSQQKPNTNDRRTKTKTKKMQVHNKHLLLWSTRSPNLISSLFIVQFIVVPLCTAFRIWNTEHFVSKGRGGVDFIFCCIWNSSK